MKAIAKGAERAVTRGSWDSKLSLIRELHVHNCERSCVKNQAGQLLKKTSQGWPLASLMHTEKQQKQNKRKSHRTKQKFKFYGKEKNM